MTGPTSCPALASCPVPAAVPLPMPILAAARAAAFPRAAAFTQAAFPQAASFLLAFLLAGSLPQVGEAQVGEAQVSKAQVSEAQVSSSRTGGIRAEKQVSPADRLRTDRLPADRLRPDTFRPGGVQEAGGTWRASGTSRADGTWRADSTWKAGGIWRANVIWKADSTWKAGGTQKIEGARTIEGTWKIDKERSTAIGPWKDLTIKIAVEIENGEKRLHLRRLWAGNYGFVAVDSIDIPIDGTFHPAPLKEWPDNRHIGGFAYPGAERLVSARWLDGGWLDGGGTLQVSTRMEISVSQGTAQVRTYSEYRPGPDGRELTALELRSTRPRPIRYVLERRSWSGSRQSRQSPEQAVARVTGRLTEVPLTECR